MISVIIISRDNNFRDHTREILKGSDLIEVKAELNNFDSAPDSWKFGEIMDMQSSIIIVDASPFEESVGRTIDFFKKSYVFASGDPTDLNLVLRCMRAGAKEFLTAPIQAKQLFCAIERVRKVIHSR